jgi:serine palmitoyltransferase
LFFLQRLSGLAYTFSASLPAILSVSALESLKAIDATPSLLTTLQENSTLLRTHLLTKGGGLPSSVVMSSAEKGLSYPVPFVHIWLRTRLSEREEEEKVLQEVVETALKEGVVLTRAKYAVGQELYLPAPSVRVTVSAGHSKKEVERAAGVVRDAFKKVLKGRRI